MKRLDVTLVELGLSPSRSKAQELIESGEVEVLVNGKWQAIRQSAFGLKESGSNHVRLIGDSQTLKYVSRGGLKLEGALKHLGLNVSGFRVLDVGMSTGGFTDCVLQAGAREVCGIDVGHGQLHSTLAVDKRVRSFEGIHVKSLGAHADIQKWLSQGVDLCVADLSFISLLSVVGDIGALLPVGCRFLGLIKPQFEMGAAQLNKSGIVKAKDPSVFVPLEADARRALTQAKFDQVQFFPSGLKGRDGNQEFFAYGQKQINPKNCLHPKGPL